MHIGHRIKEIFEAKPKTCTVSWLAEELHCDRRNIYRIFSKDNIDIKLLAKISEILDHDFFEDLHINNKCHHRTQYESIPDTDI